MTQDDRDDVLNLARCMIWMVSTVHQAHHGADNPKTWRECRIGVCGSIEHLLSHVGLDRDLQPVERVPVHPDRLP